MKQITLTPESKGKYLVRFTPNSVWDDGWPRGNDALPAQIEPSKYKGRLYIIWDNSSRAHVPPQAIQAFELEDLDINSEKYDLHELYEEQKDTIPKLYKGDFKNGMSIQLCGIQIYLMPDGTYFLNDTTGG